MRKSMSHTLSADDIINYMELMRNEEQRTILMRFFKTGKGEYGYGDQFLGIKVPQTREVVKHSADLPISEIPKLLINKYHEVRLCGFLLLVNLFEKQSTKRLADDTDAISKRDAIVSLYLKYSTYANNWDLVDLSAPKILGKWLMLPTNLGKQVDIIDKLAQSNNLWQQRMSMVCTWTPSHNADAQWCLRYATMHIQHTHDLMHKAVGWMLREMGKGCGVELLRQFLQQHLPIMSRTTLRYAIEKLPEEERKMWLRK